jgi:hypothetical protein
VASTSALQRIKVPPPSSGARSNVLSTEMPPPKVFPRAEACVFRLAELVEVDRELQLEAAEQRHADEQGPVVPVGLDTLDRGKRLSECIRIGQRTVDLRRRRLEALLPSDLHAPRVMRARVVESHLTG